ncbi:DegT/DnrJ/EryC1/StrS family aminotransferase [Nordella sp. HKS 07]|uniref:DegT/DnrJ/EryC1/StrS family aminotransferase n=1 Tax=Nordella sp. HKS 07 TaxID=2712222 RepID=UPI0013E1EB3E|nr:DegT/DnrJ/EryC1/StrS family aminotransferase [Nordella sp. HKS 07]QIG48361.1 DegT/DnrJ/EryC1/StrS family aminotransferase [Nordella sp. HKS 07]
MKIPFMRIDRQFSSIRGEVMPRVMKVLESGRVLQSEDVVALERRLAELHGKQYGVAVNSGTDALVLAIAGLGLKEGARIAVTSMSFVASASAIVLNRCRPVFLDVDPNTMLMRTDRVLELVRARAVDALVAVHLYGQLLDLDEIAYEARECGIPIIEDAAQALGSTRGGRPPGGHGAVTCLSFDPTKVIGACGSGGALVTDREDIARRVRLLRYHGHVGNRVYELPGYNCQMDSIQAAIIDVKIDHLSDWQARRTAIAKRYDEGLAGFAGIRRVRTAPGNVHNHHKYVLHVEDRAALIRYLDQAGVQTSIHYTLPLHHQPCFASVAKAVRLPAVEGAVETILSLPIYAELTEDEVDFIVGALSDHLRRRRAPK